MIKKLGDILQESRIPGSDGATARKITVKLYGCGVVPKNDGRRGSAATKYYRRRAGQVIYSKLDFLNGAFGIIPPKLACSTDRCCQAGEWPHPKPKSSRILGAAKQGLMQELLGC